ncbi:TPA: GTPase-associated system all-helical protein GASH [Burkholderia cepacia]|uniref:GTPase-associated system all-helical protein GASH n=1 Tax=Burkholderia cepacia TaxID=292 RepID=UPI001CF3C76D|nr:GTPase-associated system all-helical protein GASH [Burkholderia cepacia]MCA8357625.1 hypothetical protein [Burkholderia cepacia]HDV6370367.1 hypothetical protein [Burkholderia cepacia]
MSDNIPVHLRITGLVPSNDDVDSRRAAVTSLAKAWGKISNVNQIVGKAAAIAASLGGDGVPAVDFGTEIQVAVQKHASAFLYAERPLEVGVCAGMAAVSMMSSVPGDHGWKIVDVYTNALWSSLGFQSALKDDKRENLRREVYDRALQRSLESAERARERQSVAEPVDLVVTIAEEDKATTNFQTAAMNTIAALRRNAALDREEIDFLWWSQMSRSKLLNRPLAKIAEATRLVAMGIEASSHLRRLPAQVHRELVLRTTDSDPKLDLAELLAEIGDDRAALASGVHQQSVTAYPTVFPLLNAIVTGALDCEGAKEKRLASAWGARALLESALSRMMNMGLLDK